MATSVIRLRKGETIKFRDRLYDILDVVDLHLLKAREQASGKDVLLDLRLEQVRSADPIVDRGQPAERDLLLIPKATWDVAEQRRSVVDACFSNRTKRGQAAYKSTAAAYGCSTATLYRWRDKLRQSGGLLSSLIDEERSGGKGTGRVDEKVELEMRQVIEDKYLSMQKWSIAATHEEIKRVCKNKGLPVPALNTVRKRIEWIDEKKRVARRHGAAEATDRFEPNEGSIFDSFGAWPLSVVQMDHTQLPVIIVDDEHRVHIKRPWITVIIDTFSRVCLGIYLTLEAPHAAAAGKCLAHAILRKEAWLTEHEFDLDGEGWSYWGTPENLLMDNAKEFRGKLLEMSCNEYGIDIHFRPVKQPRYGAHIERLMGTLSERLKTLEGATFANIQQRGEYKSAEEATMSYAALEKWLIAVLIEYHHTVHSGIGTTPDQKWKEGIFKGTDGNLPRGVPDIHDDVEQVRRDFLPAFERTIQPDGVSIDGITYWDNLLRPYVGMKESATSNKMKMFIFRRDPDDVSEVYFFDDNNKQFATIGSTAKAMSVWEWRAVKTAAAKEAKERGRDPKDERLVHEMQNKRRQLQDEEAEKTRSARTERQKRAIQQKKKAAAPEATRKRSEPAQTDLDDYDEGAIQAIEE